MKLNSKELSFFGERIDNVSKYKECSIYHMQDNTGNGYITCYDVFKGITLMYNNFKMFSCYSNVEPNPNILEFNHCSDGRIECSLDNGTYCYLERDDLCICPKQIKVVSSYFPTKYYHGISICLDYSLISQDVIEFFYQFNIDIVGVYNKFCNYNDIVTIKENQQINHIFSELYCVPKSLKMGYFKTKILELFLFVSNLDINAERMEKEYFCKTHVNKIKASVELISKDLSIKYTITEISKMFDLSQTTFKKCFKAVYGKPFYTFIKTMRIQHAQYLLKSTNMSILDIALSVGYTNSSKFSSAFKNETSMTPMQYRKSSLKGTF